MAGIHIELGKCLLHEVRLIYEQLTFATVAMSYGCELDQAETTHAMVAIDSDKEDPATYQEALASTDSAGWKKAMAEEYESLVKNGTWILTKLPDGRSAI